MNIINFIKITRPLNLIIIILCFILTNLVIDEQFIKNLPILFVILLLTAFANVINDIFDLKIDVDNKINRPIASKKINPNIALLFSILLVFSAVYIIFIYSFDINSKILILGFNLPLIILYTPFFKKIPLIGNIIVSLLLSMVFIVSSIYITNTIHISLYPLIIFSFILMLIREIVKDIQDLDGDKKNNVHTLPVKYGIRLSINLIVCLVFILFVFTIMAFYLYEQYNFLYLMNVLIFIHLPLFMHVYQLHKNKSSTYCIYLSKVLKLITIFGVIVIYLTTI